MKEKRDSVPPAVVSPRRMIPRPFDTSNHLAQRRAVQALIEHQRVLISSKRFQGRGMKARVLVDGELYDVDELRLKQLQSGLTPADLMLDPVVGDEED